MVEGVMNGIYGREFRLDGMYFTTYCVRDPGICSWRGVCEGKHCDGMDMAGIVFALCETLVNVGYSIMHHCGSN